MTQAVTEGAGRFALQRLATQYQVACFLALNGPASSQGEALSTLLARHSEPGAPAADVAPARAAPTGGRGGARGDRCGATDAQPLLPACRCLLYLNDHTPAGAGPVAGGREAALPRQAWPVLQALEKLRGHDGNALILIDELWRYRRDFRAVHGALPGSIEDGFACEHELLALLEARRDTHILRWHHEEGGYAVLWPLAWGAYDLLKWVRAGDENNDQQLQTGVPGSTCMSLMRRVHDARFSNRWLVGRGLDIGGRTDSIGWYRNLFPGIRSVTVYDLEQGDAQYLANVADEEFDFVYSAHCLEHLVDPCVALGHWLRVLKPGGHLVVTVPDEDMYEQGGWPSTFNSDHKHTFTVFRRHSWSPVSINVLELLQVFQTEVCIERIERLSHAFLPGYVRFDQTRTAFAECGIEIVIRKGAASQT